MSANQCLGEDKKARINAYPDDVSNSQIARDLGIDRGCVIKYRVKPPVGSPLPSRGFVQNLAAERLTDPTTLFTPSPTPDPIKEREERLARARELALEREQLNAVAGERSFRTFLGDLFREVAEPFEPVDLPATPKTRSTAKQHTRYPLLHLSDWHFEEVVKPESVMGMNEYNVEVACRRLYRVIHAFLDWKQTQNAGGIAMTELLVALNGDLLTGTLHGLERHSSAPNVVRATLACGRLIALVLRDLAPHFPLIRVYGTVGNHGRLPDDKKVPTKDPTRSFDYLAYAIAQELLRETSHIQFNLPEAYGTAYQVGGHWVCQGHGNFINNPLGVVGYGVRRHVSNLAANMGAAGKPLKYAVFGHFHQASSAEFAGVTAFIGPSLIGTQEYGFLKGGSVNRPAQQCYVFDKDLGHTETINLFGDGPHYDGAYPVGF